MTSKSAFMLENSCYLRILQGIPRQSSALSKTVTNTSLFITLRIKQWLNLVKYKNQQKNSDQTESPFHPLWHQPHEINK